MLYVQVDLFEKTGRNNEGKINQIHLFVDISYIKDVF